MKIRILSQKSIKKYISNKSHIVISIRDSLEPSFPLPNNQKRLDALRLQFDDFNINNEDYYKLMDLNIVAFDKTMAKRIKNFVLKYPKAEELLINCMMGISRSAAVAKALHKWKPDLYESGLQPFHRPNLFVYETLLDVLNTTDN